MNALFQQQCSALAGGFADGLTRPVTRAATWLLVAEHRGGMMRGWCIYVVLRRQRGTDLCVCVHQCVPRAIVTRLR